MKVGKTFCIKMIFSRRLKFAVICVKNCFTCAVNIFLYFIELIFSGLSGFHIDLKTLQAVSSMLAHYSPIIQVRNDFKLTNSV